jgi:hypothetical protein
MNDALGKALAAEHAAVYAYGVIGAKATGTFRRLADAGFDAHRARRDQLRALIVGRGGSPAEPGPTYRLPFDVADRRDVARLGAQIEDGVTAAYLELAAEPDASLRRLAALALQESAVREHAWTGQLPAFPGMPAAGATTSPPPRSGPSPTPPSVSP